MKQISVRTFVPLQKWYKESEEVGRKLRRQRRREKEKE